MNNTETPIGDQSTVIDTNNKPTTPIDPLVQGINLDIDNTDIQEEFQLLDSVREAHRDFYRGGNYINSDER